MFFILNKKANTIITTTTTEWTHTYQFSGDGKSYRCGVTVGEQTGGLAVSG